MMNLWQIFFMIHTFWKKGVSRNWGARKGLWLCFSMCGGMAGSDAWNMFLCIFQGFDFLKTYIFENPKYPFDTIFLYITHSKSPLKGSPIYLHISLWHYSPVYLPCPPRMPRLGRWTLDAGGGRGAAVRQAVARGAACAWHDISYGPTPFISHTFYIPPAMTNIIYDIAYTDDLLFMIYEKYVPKVEYQYPKNKLSLCKEQTFTLGEQSL